MGFIELFVFEETNVFFLEFRTLFFFLCLLPSLIKDWSLVFSSEKQASLLNSGFLFEILFGLLLFSFFFFSKNRH